MKCLVCLFNFFAGAFFFFNRDASKETKISFKGIPQVKDMPKSSSNNNRRNYHIFCVPTVMTCSVFQENVSMVV